jgi:DNA-binding XRE family transcriptional regulator
MNRNIEAERARLNMTQEQVAQQLGVSSKTYFNYVRGRAIPSTILVRMAKLFSCSTDYLLGIEPTNKAS